MPPFVARKRRPSTSPPSSPQIQPTITRKTKKKPSLFDTLDAKPESSNTLQDNKVFIDGLEDGESSSSLSEISRSEFEEVLPSHPNKRRKIDVDPAGDDDEDEEEDIQWEDAIAPEVTVPTTPSAGPSGALELTLDKGINAQSLASQSGSKKGPSKIERQIRTQTHCMHVQFLLFHNLVRNAWVCDEEVQKILVERLTPDIERHLRTWKRDSGLDVEAKKEPKPIRKGEGKAKDRKAAAAEERNQRDWGGKAERLETGVPNISRGDPLIKLLQELSKIWKKKFKITAPGLRKQGYKHLSVLEAEIASFQNEEHNPEEHGERITNVQHFREHARRCEGSRDVGAQLFTALLRGLGFEARMVTNLQPVGFGWSKAEDAPTRKRKRHGAAGTASPHAEQSSDDESAHSDEGISTIASSGKSKAKKIGKKTGDSNSQLRVRQRSTAVLLDDSSGLSSLSSDDDSIIAITPSKNPLKAYDRDLPYPIYWTEVLSPISNNYVSADPMILPLRIVEAFEPRGTKAEKAKQVMAYVAAFSADGTAKDVTVRYLKRHMWPGKTKGMRIPVEKVPVYNKRGKVKRYDEYDWFKSVMSGYSRTSKQRTGADGVEEENDLKPVKVARNVEHREDTLQGYKNSAEFILERHLRREEALRPGSVHVKTFTTGKGDKAKEENVYRREDVAICRTGESWHKEGREVAPGQQPIKMVPVRAVTLTRKREVEEAEREGGEKLKQGMYSIEQTKWIIPPPIQNGVIPKNAYGNIDCFVPTLVPEGAVHIPQRGTAKICKRLNIDFAEAVTGFEFGKQRAVPVIDGVVVAAGNEDMVMEAWEADEEEKRKKEEGKREKAALAMWRKFVMGLRIVQRVKEEYGGSAAGHLPEEINPFTRTKASNKTKLPSVSAAQEPVPLPYEDTEMAGGFVPDDDDDAEIDNAGGFLLDEEDDGDRSGSNKPSVSISYPQTPVSLSSVHQEKRPPTIRTHAIDNDCGVEKQTRHTPASAGGKVDETASAKDKGTAPKAKVKQEIEPPGDGNESSPEVSHNKHDSKLLNRQPRVSAKRHTRKNDKVPKATSGGKSAKKAVKSPYFKGSSSDQQSGDDSSTSGHHEPSQKMGNASRIVPKRQATKKGLGAKKSIYVVSESSDEFEDEAEDDGEVVDAEVNTAAGKSGERGKSKDASQMNGLRRSTRKTK